MADQALDSKDKGDLNKKFMIWDDAIRRENRCHAVITKTCFSLNHLPAIVKGKVNGSAEIVDDEKIRDLVRGFASKKDKEFLPVTSYQGIGWRCLDFLSPDAAQTELTLPSINQSDKPIACNEPTDYQQAFSRILAEEFPNGVPPDFHMQEFERVFLKSKAVDVIRSSIDDAPVGTRTDVSAPSEDLLRAQECIVKQAVSNLGRFHIIRSAYHRPRDSSPEVEYATEFFKTKGTGLYLKPKGSDL